MKRHTEETRRFIAAGEELRLLLTHEAPDRLAYRVRLKRGTGKAGLLSAHPGPVPAREAYEAAALDLIAGGWKETLLRAELVTIPQAPGVIVTRLPAADMAGDRVSVLPQSSDSTVTLPPCAHPKLAHLLPTRPASRSLDCEDCGAMVPGTMVPA